MDGAIGRRERKKKKSRQAIIDAAVQEFSRKGFRDTSVADIMDVADLGIGTFYNYFASKEEVLLSLLALFVEDTQAEIDELREGDCPAIKLLETACARTAKFLDENRFVLPLFLSAAAHSAMPEGTEIKKRPESPGFKDVFAKIINYGQEQGTFRNDIPADIITELFHSIFQAASFSSLDFSFQENVALKMKVIMAGIVHHE